MQFYLYAVSLLLLISSHQTQGQVGSAAGPPWMPKSAAATQGPTPPEPFRSPGTAARGSAAQLPGSGRSAAAAAAPAAGNGQQRPQPARPSIAQGPAGVPIRRRRPIRSAAPRGARARNSPAAAAANPPGSLHNLLAKNTPLFRSLFTVLGISAEQISEGVVGTLFAPSDEAVSAFLEDMGLTAQQLAARPELVDMIVSYHFVPGYQLPGPDDLADDSKVLLTGDEQFILRIAPAAAASGKMALTDVQRSKANVLEGPMSPPDSPGLSVYIIDKVLRSANYFLSIEAALGHSPYWITAKNTAVKAKVLPQLEGTAITLLVPDNAAFKPLEANLSRASPGRLADILQYHTLPKVRRVPRGFESGTADTLLKGHRVEINATEQQQKDTFSGNKTLVPVITVTPEVGRPAKLSYFNIYAGKAILHGISGLLLPDLPPDPDEAPPAEDEQPPEDEEAPADVAEEAGPGRPGLPRRGGGTSGVPKAGRPGSDAAEDGPDSPVPRAGGGSSGSSRGQRPGSSSKAAPEDDDAVDGRGGGGGGGIGGRAADPGTPGRSSPAGRLAGGAAGGPAGGSTAGSRPQGQGPAAAAPAGVVPSRRPAAPAEVAAVAGDDANDPGRHLLTVGADVPVGSVGAATRGLREAQGVAGIAQAKQPRKGVSAVPSGALSSTVNVGAVGELQTTPNGISTDKTLTAFMLAAQPKVPKQYVNRYGAFKGPTTKGGCLNCKAWGKQA